MIDTDNTKVKSVGEYTIYFGPAEASRPLHVPIYKVINNKTNVLELETSVLPQAFVFAFKMSHYLNKVTDPAYWERYWNALSFDDGSLSGEQEDIENDLGMDGKFKLN